MTTKSLKLLTALLLSGLTLLLLALPVAALTWTNRTTVDGLGGNFLYGVFADGSTVYAATENGLAIANTDSDENLLPLGALCRHDSDGPV